MPQGRANNRPTAAANSDACEEDGGEAPQLWGHMQRIELYRHRAFLVEREAEDASAQSQEKLSLIGRLWRELATSAEQLAAEVEN